MECAFKGCDRKAICKGLCPGHYQQQRHGKPLTPLKKQVHGVPEAARLMAWTDRKGPKDCWNFTGARQRGNQWHGQFWSDNGNEPAHRAAYRLWVGPIPAGMCVCHKCDNPICLNPAHLFLGSLGDNAKDMWDKGRAKPGKSVGESHGCAKLTEAIVKEIRESAASGVELARKYGITPTTVCDIRKRRSWNHV